MMDQVQRTSVVPLPVYQTIEGSHDPLPVTSPRLQEQKASDRAEAGIAAQSDAFKDYLDQSSITVVEDVSKKRHPDAADLISRNSVYVGPGLLVGG